MDDIIIGISMAHKGHENAAEPMGLLFPQATNCQPKNHKQVL